MRETMEITLDDQQKLKKVKFRLLAEGMRIDSSADDQLGTMKHPIRTRSGVSGGLDIRINKHVYVNVPVKEIFAQKSNLELRFSDGNFFLADGDEFVSDVELLPIPEYYALQTSDGLEQMKRIGQMCSGDRFCYGMTGPGCYFWAKSKRCKYCSIGNNYDADAAKKKEKHLMEVLRAAINDKAHPAKHVLLGGGTPPGEDMGALLAARLCKMIKSEFDVSIYVMISAPLKNEYIDTIYDAGADELGMNLEFWSEQAWQEYIPGKHKEIGKERYVEALEYAVKRFGPINTRTIFIAGLESSKYTIEGAETVASMGIMPIISPFRSLNGTMLQHVDGFTSDGYVEMFDTLYERVTTKHDMPLGPTCICCQNNTLALPFGKSFRYY